MQSAGYFCPVLTKLEFGRQISFKTPGIQCLETVQWEPYLFHEDREAWRL